MCALRAWSLGLGTVVGEKKAPGCGIEPTNIFLFREGVTRDVERHELVTEE